MSFGDDIHDVEPSASATRDPLDAFDGFVREVRDRLEAGRAAYGDRSFARPPVELVGELQQEALDLAGWGFVLWCRLEAMRGAAR
ncbi:MAG: hypothetical protein ABI548_02820 [Polyangiaceae bacterium]